MDVSYNKLFKLLIDKKMKKKDLQEAAGLSPASIAKLSKGQYVSMDVLVKICKALDCSINDLFDTDDPQVKRLLTYAYNISKGDTE